LKINFDDRTEPIDRIVFDLNGKFCALVSKTKIKILNINLGENQKVFTYSMPEIYDQILEVVLDSCHSVKN